MQQTNPMRMERRRLADLIPAAYNPRKALTPEDPEYQDIKASIQGLGYADPIVINYDGTIIKGHQRRTVMMDMGIEEAEVVVLDIRDKAKEKMINVALNKITGKWDLQILFLSTPSARRATAKTETKSLFSYKLYNILHEFRRALIYNGSKSYPNHAK